MLLRITLLNITLFFSSWAFASIIDVNSYISDNDNLQYWTNNDLDLEIMRLSYSSTILRNGLASEQLTDYEEVNSFVESQDEWRWATLAEFDSVYQWFDSDLDNIGWSVEQLFGSNLFFELNHFPNGFESFDNNGYDDQGRIYWSLHTKFNESNILFSEITMTSENTNEVTCTYSVCGYGYLYEDYISDLAHVVSISNYETSYTRAPLIVKNISVEVPEPSTLTIFALALIGLASLRFKKH